MPRSYISISLVLLVVPAGQAADDEFAERIAPLLVKRCVSCHSGDKPKGDLNLIDRAKVIEGGASGSALVPGNASKSLLFTKVRERQMPPKEALDEAEIATLGRWIDSGAPWRGELKPAITTGSKGRAGLDWWALQPIRRPLASTLVAGMRNPIDAFVRARLQAAGLELSEETDRRTYIRRVSLDLTGLPPTPEEVDAFVSDTSTNAYEKLVDRLLASPAYGETWARHWLDVIRFAESHGYEMNTLRPNAWPYRDYVIRAFNRDIPFKQFVIEQLAGDQLENADELQQAATGFLVSGPKDLVGNQTIEGKLQERADSLFDMTATTGSAFLGLTVGCARCHDHKFDPISQRDFYRLQAVFSGVEHAERPIRGSSNEHRRHELERLRAELTRLESQLNIDAPLADPKVREPRRSSVNARRNVEQFRDVDVRFVRFAINATNDGTQPCIDEIEIYGPDKTAGNLALQKGAKATASSEYPNAAIHKIAHLNDGRHGNSWSWISNEAGRGWAQIELPKATTINRIVWARDREQKYRDRLATDYRIEVSADGRTWTTIAGSNDRRPFGKDQDPAVSPAELTIRKLAIEIDSLSKPRAAYAGTFRTPDATHVLKRGDPMQKLDAVAAGSLTGIGAPFQLPADVAEPQRRRALAEWIASPDNPLPARVFVNRIWHHHFGQGIVRTPSDFGFNGDRPSHPELLDWLASEFLANGGHLKPLHRLIVLSSTYRQLSRIDTAKATIDADNRLLWRFPSRRLEAEKIRDSMVRISGALNRTMGGPGYHLWNYSGYVIVFAPKPKLGPDEFRRMIYQFKPRTQQDGTFGAFDCPDATAVAPRRSVSNTPLQALNLLNDEFVHDQADRFAALLVAVSSNSSGQVEEAFRRVFGRVPSATEARGALILVEKHGLPALTRALFNATEFVTLE